MAVRRPHAMNFIWVADKNKKKKDIDIVISYVCILLVLLTATDYTGSAAYFIGFIFLNFI